MVGEIHLVFSILTEDGIAASAEPVAGIKRLGQRLERANRLRGKAADEKTRLHVDDPAMTSFAVIKHEPHLPFRYGSIIAGTVYNNTDIAVLPASVMPEMQKNRRYRRFFWDFGRVSQFCGLKTKSKPNEVGSIWKGGEAE